MTSLLTGIRISLLTGLLSAVVLVFGPCGSGATSKKIPTGSWGGEHISLEVSSNGAEVELDCAHGHIAGAISPDKNGKFDVAGTYSPEHGGPIRRDETPISDPARYSGRVDGDTMTITITRGKDEIGPYTLTRGTAATLRKCR